MGMLAGATMVLMPAPTIMLSLYELGALLMLVRNKPTRDARPPGNQEPTVSYPIWYMTGPWTTPSANCITNKLTMGFI